MKYLLINLLMLFILVGCGSRTNHYIVVKKQPIVAIALPIDKPISHVIKKQHTRKKHHKHHTKKQLPAPPKKKIRLKRVEDNNYNDNYMYPEDTHAAKKDPNERKVSTTVLHKSMKREECIGMIGQEKFDKYTAMFGSEVASIKRCAMIKAMNK